MVRTPLFLLSIGLILTGFPAIADDWRVEAGPVEISHGNEPLARGSFRVLAPAGTLPDAAPRSGGACLVADLVRHGVGLANCVSNAECNGPDAIDRAGDPRLEAFIGYCVARDGSGQAPRCWTRPGPAEIYCRRSASGLRLSPGLHELGPVDADPLQQGAPWPEWAVYACMADEGHKRACGQAVDAHRQTSLTPANGGDN
jgi:hypothetical protein